MRKKKQQDQENQAIGFASAPATATRLTPADIQSKEFRLAFRGYNERDVDEFLDRVTEQLAAHIEENERLRQGSGAATVGISTAAVTDRSSEADDIVARAREQAVAIVREAEAKAAALATLGAPRAGDERAVIAPYLQREGEFLQSLGRLVQDHAQNVRAMVRRSKGVPTPVASTEPETAAVSTEPETAAVSTEPETTVVSTEPETTVAPQTAPAAGAPSATASDLPGGAAPGPGERPSLRELFWGED